MPSCVRFCIFFQAIVILRRQRPRQPICVIRADPLNFQRFVTPQPHQSPRPSGVRMIPRPDRT
jgi:hypothetical protein